MARELVNVNSTGDVVSGPVWLHSAVLTPAAAASTLAVRDGSGGDVRLALQAAADGHSAVWQSGDPQGVLFSDAVHATLSGSEATASFEYS